MPCCKKTSTPAVKKPAAWQKAGIQALHIKRIGTAVENAAGDARILSAAVGPARVEHARLILIHVVDAPGARLLGS